MKTYSKIVGNTGAQLQKGETTPKDARFPNLNVTPGAKLINFGETALASDFNRAFEVLTGNIEQLYNFLLTPAGIPTRLEYSRTADGYTYGFSELEVDTGQTEVRLGAGLHKPAVWVYHGLHKQSLSRYIRLTNKASVSNTSSRLRIVSPLDIKEVTAGPSLFPTSNSLGSAYRGLADSIVPIRRVKTELPPYNGGVSPEDIASWESDGFKVTARTLASMFAQPGCYVEIISEAPNNGNNGLYRIASISGVESGADKVVLTSGGLHKVTVTDASNFTVGELLSWAPSPYNVFGFDGSRRTHFAHLVYKIDNTLYLAPSNASEDIEVGGEAAGANADNSIYGGRQAVGHVGNIDTEAGATSNWILPTGTVLYGAVSLAFSDAVTVQEAGSPVWFDTTVQPGAFYICTPLGFSLNPVMVFAATDLLSGKYDADVLALTTLKDTLIGSYDASTKGEVTNPIALVSLLKEQAADIENSLNTIRNGLLNTTVKNLNSAFSGTRQILGSDVWKLTLVNDTDADTAEEAGLVAGAKIFTHPQGDGLAQTAVYVDSVSDNTVTAYGASTYLWNYKYDFNVAPIIAGTDVTGSKIVIDGKNFHVSEIAESPVINSDVAGNVWPTQGLNAAYHNHFDALPYNRHVDMGRFIEVLNNKPIVLLLGNNANDLREAFEIRSDSTDVDMLRLYDRATGADLRSIFGYYKDANNEEGTHVASKTGKVYLSSIARALLAAFEYADGILKFSDQNTGIDVPVPMSNALTALETAEVGSELPEALQGNSILGSIHAALLGGKSDTDSHRALGDGLLWCEGGSPVADFARTLVSYPSDLDITNGSNDIYISGTDAFDTYNAIIINGVLRIKTNKVSATGEPLIEYRKVTAKETEAGPLYKLTTVADPAGGIEGFTTTVDSADWSVVQLPLQVDVKEAHLVHCGRVHKITTTTLVATANQVRYVTYIPSTNTYASLTSSSASSEGDDRIILAKVTTNDFTITEIVDIAHRVQRVDQKTHLTVGDTGASPTGDISHFKTIGAAFKYIEKWAAVSTSKKTWFIDIIGTCTEVEDIDHGIKHPLQVPDDGVVISSGLQTVNTGAALIKWSTPCHLFNVGTKAGFTLRGTHSAYTGAWGTFRFGANEKPAVCLIANQNIVGDYIATVRGILLENCLQEDGSGLIAVIDATSCEDITVKNCKAYEVKSAAVYAASSTDDWCDSLTIDDLTITTDTTGSPDYTTKLAGLVIDGVVRIYTNDVSISEGDGKGVYLARYTRAAISNAHITNTALSAFFIEDAQSGTDCSCAIDNCSAKWADDTPAVPGDVFSATSVGIEATANNVSVNNFLAVNPQVAVQVGNTSGDSANNFQCNKLTVVNAYAAIAVASGLDAVFDGFHIVDCDSHAVHTRLSSLVSRAVFRNGKVNILGGHGFTIASRYTVIESCVVMGANGTTPAVRGIELAATTNDLDGADYCVIRNCEIKNLQYGVNVNPDNVLLTGNKISNFSNTGINVGSEYGSNTKIINCHFDSEGNAGAIGVALVGDADNDRLTICVVDNCSFRMVSHCVSMKWVNNSQVKNCKMVNVVTGATNTANTGVINLVACSNNIVDNCYIAMADGESTSVLSIGIGTAIGGAVSNDASDDNVISNNTLNDRGIVNDIGTSPGHRTVVKGNVLQSATAGITCKALYDIIEDNDLNGGDITTYTVGGPVNNNRLASGDIVIHGGNTDSQVTNNTLKGGDIKLYGLGSHMVSHNTTGGGNIMFFNEGGWPEQTVVTHNNTLLDNDTGGAITLDTCTNVTIVLNSIGTIDNVGNTGVISANNYMLVPVP